MNVPFVDLRRQYKSVKPQIDAAIKRVIQSGRFIGGPECESFEKEFAAYLGVKHVLGVNSGTDALILGACALGLNAGDEMIVPANTFYASVLAATQNGFKTVFVDIDPSDNGISIPDLKRKLSGRTKAIMAVHLYGQSDKIGEIKAVIKQTGRTVHLIEDACQAHGATFDGKKAGTFGAFGTYSFYPAKNLGAYGDGGAIATQDDRLAKKIALAREYGQTKKYHHDVMGVNSRLDPLQAAILKVKLSKLDAWNKRRQVHAALYSKILAGIPSVTPPASFAERPSVYHLYVIRAKRRNSLQKYLGEKAIHTQIHYPIPLHLQKAFSYLKYKRGDFPHAEAAANEILSLPMFPELTEPQIRFVGQTIKNFYLG